MNLINQSMLNYLQIIINFTQENLLVISLTLNIIFILNLLSNICKNIKPSPTIIQLIDKLPDDDFEQIINLIKTRFIIPKYYTKNSIIKLISKNNLNNIDLLWKYLLDNNNILSNEYDDIMMEFIENYYSIKNDNLEEKNSNIELNTNKNTINNLLESVTSNNTLENLLETLSYGKLQEYSGTNNNSKTKTELIKIIMENFNKLKKKLNERKLNILNKQLD